MSLGKKESFIESRENMLEQNITVSVGDRRNGSLINNNNNNNN